MSDETMDAPIEDLPVGLVPPKKPRTREPMHEDPLIGQRIGGCRILSRIGGGGMGTVYRAVQERLRAPAAVKVIRHGFGRDKSAVARFEREAHEIARLRGRTANVVQVYDFGFDEDADLYYIVMELVEGEGLDRVLKRLGPLAEESAIRIARQAAAGLEVARAHGLVHRDIKPENLLLTQDGVVKITDFGLAKGLDAGTHMTASGQIMGTPAYMSPEQCNGESDIDHRSDLYSLGATLFTLVTGRSPYEADTTWGMIVHHLKSPVPDPVEAGAAIGEELSLVVQILMEKDREERFQTAGELQEALAEIMADKSGALRSDKESLSTLVGSSGSQLVVLDAEISESLRVTPRPSTRGAQAGITFLQRKKLLAGMGAGLVGAVGIAGAIALGGRGDTAPAASPAQSPAVAPASPPTGPAPAPAGGSLGLPKPLVPEPGQLLVEPAVTVRGEWTGPTEGVWVRVNGVAARLRGARQYEASVQLAEGRHTLTVAVGREGEDDPADDRSLEVRVDLAAPRIEILEPADGAITSAERVAVTGAVDDTTACRVRVGAADVDGRDGRFRHEVELREGPNRIEVSAVDEVSRRSAATITVIRDSTPPAIAPDPVAPVVEVARLRLTGRVADSTASTLTVRGQAVPLDPAGGFSVELTLAPGETAIEVVATDAGGNVASARLEVQCRPLPEGLVPAGTPAVYRWTADGAEMVRVLGDGALRLYIDRHEVTVGQYARFLVAVGDDHRHCDTREPETKSHEPGHWAAQQADGDGMPVRFVDWWDAVAYARWAGKDLPTVTEWAGAAGRGAYPWGDAPPTARHAVFGRLRRAGQERPEAAAGASRVAGASPCGALDLAGNVAEWCLDAVGRGGGKRPLRGGSWASSGDDCRLAAGVDEHPAERWSTIGFRCVRRFQP